MMVSIAMQMQQLQVKYGECLIIGCIETEGTKKMRCSNSKCINSRCLIIGCIGTDCTEKRSGFTANMNTKSSTPRISNNKNLI
eukprot:6616931-Ditylum_brightwellii.AAC.1